MTQTSKTPRRRKTSIRTLIKRVERATGKPVTCVTTPEGYTLHVGEPVQASSGESDALDNWIAKKDAHPA